MNWSEQKLELFKFNDNYCVKAGAGSGKTAALVHLNSCFLEGTASIGEVGVDEILAITFTDLAAAEMKERLCSMIDAHIRIASCESESRKWKRIRTMLASAHISTFNSFCLRLLKENPVEANLSPDFETVDPAQASELLERSVADALASASVKVEYDEIFLAYGFDDLKDKIIAGIEMARDFSAIGSLREILSKNVYGIKREFKRALGELALQFEYLSEYCDSRLSMGKTSKFVEAFVSFRSYLKTFFLDAAFNKYDDVFENDKNAKIRESDFKEKFRKVWELSKIRNSLRDEAKEEFVNFKNNVEHIRLIINFFEALPLTFNFISLFEITEKNYSIRKRKLNCIDFSDQLLMVKNLLMRNKNLRRKYKRKFKAVVVDEFQDVNKLQKDIIFLLCERDDFEDDFVSDEELSGVNLQKRKLFAVGDLKQSIYGFRGADVSVFSDMIESMEKNKTGKKLAFKDNFRTVAEIIDPLNDFFSRIMNASGNKFIYPFTEDDALEAKRIAGTDSEASIEFVVSPGFGLDKSDIPATEAESIACWLINELPKVQIEENGEFRPGELKDAAILFKRTTKIDVYLSVLKKYSIPYALENGKGFYSSAEVNDLMAVFSFLCGKNKRFSLACALRSPLCGVSDDTFYKVTAKTEFKDFMEMSDDEIFELVYEEEFNRVVKFRDSLKKLSCIVNLTPPSKLLKYIVKEFSYLYILRNTFAGAVKEANVEKLIRTACDYEQGVFRDVSCSVFDFLTFFEKQKAKDIEREAAAYTENAVRIMSVHKSKGMEFPVTILCDTASKGRGREFGVCFSPDRGIGIKKYNDKRELEENILTREIFLENRLREEAESLRVLYVALTRARDYVVIFLPFVFSKGAKSDVGALRQECESFFSELSLEKSDNWQELFYLFIGCGNMTRAFFEYYDNKANNEKAFFHKISEVGENGAKNKIKISVRNSDFKPGLNVKNQAITPDADFSAYQVEKEVCESLDNIKRYGSLLYLTPTKILSWHLCKRRYLYESFRETGEGSFYVSRLKGPYAEKALEIGSIVHYFLRRIDFSDRRLSPGNQLLRVFEQAKDLALSADSLEKARLSVERFLSVPEELRDFFRADSSFMPEHKLYFSCRSDPYIYIDGIIDMLIIKKDGDIAVIDYKFGDISSGKVKFYENQLKTYICGIAKAVSIEKIKGFIVFMTPERVDVHRMVLSARKINNFEKKLLDIGRTILRKPLIESEWTPDRRMCEEIACPYIKRCSDF